MALYIEKTSWPIKMKKKKKNYAKNVYSRKLTAKKEVNYFGMQSKPFS